MGNFENFCPCQEKEDKNKYQKEEEEKEYIEEGILTTQDDERYHRRKTVGDLSEFRFSTRELIHERKDRWENKYDLGKILGEGSYGKVYKVTTKEGGLERAMKEISKSRVKNVNEMDKILAEINVLKNLDHPNIMKIYEFYDTDDRFYIISEFCDKGCLCDLEDQSKLFKFPEIIVKYVLKRILQAITYLHENKYMHGDIKGENILLITKNDSLVPEFKDLVKELSKDKQLQEDINKGIKNEKTINYIKQLSEYDIKLVDFGFARFFSGKERKQMGEVGTPYFYAPETTEGKHCMESDEWAVGVLMYILLTASVPFDAESYEELYDKINKPNPDLKKLKDVSYNCINLMKGFLISDFKYRLKAEEALNDPFFTENNFVEEQISLQQSENVKRKMEDFTLNMVESGTYSQSKFRDMVIGYITLNYISKEEEAKIAEIFSELSKGSGSGHIKKENFIQIMKQHVNNATEEDLKQLFDRIDNDHNGSIEYQELLRAMSNKRKLINKRNLKDAFDIFDVDKSGKITFNEVSKIAFSGHVKEKALNDFLKEINKSKEDEITFDEFCKIILGTEENKEK
ncbi:MAG: protein kinase [archaeon]|nr:protein kinase [archaeon]